jgi:hypothetical protein
VYGSARLLVAPANGTGQQWVEISRVQMVERPSALAIHREEA